MMALSPHHIRDAQFFSWFLIGCAVRIWLRTDMVFQSPSNKLKSRRQYLAYNLSRMAFRFGVGSALCYWPMRHTEQVAHLIPAKILGYMGSVPQAWPTYFLLGIGADFLIDWGFMRLSTMWPWLREAIPPNDDVIPAVPASEPAKP